MRKLFVEFEIIVDGVGRVNYAGDNYFIPPETIPFLSFHFRIVSSRIFFISDIGTTFPNTPLSITPRFNFSYK